MRCFLWEQAMPTRSINTGWHSIDDHKESTYVAESIEHFRFGFRAARPKCFNFFLVCNDPAKQPFVAIPDNRHLGHNLDLIDTGPLSINRLSNPGNAISG